MEIKNNGIWTPAKPYVKSGGVWRECTEGFVRTGGSWRQFLKPNVQAGAVEYTVTLASRLGGREIGYSGYYEQDGDITPTAFNDVVIAKVNTTYRVGIGVENERYLEVWLWGDIPLDFFSRIDVEGLGEFYTADALSAGFVGDITLWQWRAPYNWPGNVGDKRKVIIYP